MLQLSSGGDYEHIGIATRSATFLLGKAVFLRAMQFVPVCSSIIISCNIYMCIYNAAHSALPTTYMTLRSQYQVIVMLLH